MQDSHLLTRLKIDTIRNGKNADLEKVKEFPCNTKITNQKNKEVLSVSGFILVFKQYLSIAIYSSSYKKKKKQSPIHISKTNQLESVTLIFC
jgi:hypothetical protein